MVNSQKSGPSLPFIFFAIYGLISILLHNFYPTLIFESSVNQFTQIIVQILAGFTYYNSEKALSFLFVNLISLFCVNFYFLRPSTRSSFSSTAKQIIYIQSLLFYLFWLTGTARNNIEKVFDLPDNYITWLIIIVLLEIGIDAMQYLILKPDTTSNSESEHQRTKPILFLCPHCGAEYHAKVLFCIKCNQEICGQKSP